MHNCALFFGQIIRTVKDMFQVHGAHILYRPKRQNFEVLIKAQLI